MTTDDEFFVDVIEEGAATRLVLHGELDLLCAEELSAAIAAVARPGGTVVLDLRELLFMDSTGLSTIITVHNAALAEGWQLALIDGGGAVGRVFDLTDTRSLLRFVASADELAS
jgi:anti-anti-sigma factor